MKPSANSSIDLDTRGTTVSSSLRKIHAAINRCSARPVPHRHAGPSLDPGPSKRVRRHREVIALLCEGLVGLGRRVTLFAAPGSRSSATVHQVLPESHPNQIGESLYESDHVARAFDALEQTAKLGQSFDIIHDK